MNPVRRLDLASAVSQVGPSTPKATPAPATPTIFPETPYPETPWAGNPEEPSAKWYHRYQKPGKRAHPYNLSAISLQVEGKVKKQSSHAQFWPFVGPYKPKKKVADVDFDEWENRVAIAAGDKLVVGRCSDEKPEEPWIVLWDLTFSDDELYQVAWTFDLFTLHPLVAVAGRKGLIYVIDAVTKACLRVLKGHGMEILSLSICQSHPHILASASGDKTLRIWNLCGSEAPPPAPTKKHNENYPMGDADEGNVCFAILAGEGNGGHRSKVIGCAFHPKHAAIASCGSDYSVKIWALPPFPAPDPTGPPTPVGYRPALVYFPVFSTNRIHQNTVDNIQWLGPDVLISRDIEEMYIWQWLGYKRFFHPHRFDGINLESQRTDYNESHSYMRLISYPSPKTSLRWYMLFGIHHAFRPTLEEEDEFEKHATLVTDPLIALPVESRPPEIHLFNPTLAQPDLPPNPITELRPVAPDDPYEVFDDEGDHEEEEADQDQKDRVMDIDGETEISLESEEVPADLTTEKVKDAEANVDISMSLETPPRISTPTRASLKAQSLENGLGTEKMSAIERVKLQPRKSKSKPVTLVPESLATPSDGKRVANGRKGTKEDKAKEKEAGKKKKNQSLAPYVLKAGAWQSAVKSSPLAHPGPLERSVISCCAISPRGAQWIVGVGDVQSVFVWKLQL